VHGDGAAGGHARDDQGGVGRAALADGQARHHPAAAGGDPARATPAQLGPDPELHVPAREHHQLVYDVGVVQRAPRGGTALVTDEQVARPVRAEPGHIHEATGVSGASTAEVAGLSRSHPMRCAELSAPAMWTPGSAGPLAPRPEYCPLPPPNVTYVFEEMYTCDPWQRTPKVGYCVALTVRKNRSGCDHGRTVRYVVPRKGKGKGMLTPYAPSSTEYAMMVLVMKRHPRGTASPDPMTAVGDCRVNKIGRLVSGSC
jgi:hypothetical protein